MLNSFSKQQITYLFFLDRMFYFCITVIKMVN